MKLNHWGIGASAATVAFALFAVTANAQEKPAAAPKATPATKAAPATPKVAPATKAAPAAAAPEKKKAKAAPSPCKGLDEAACKAKADTCGWIVPTKVDAKTGKADKPYCRKVAGIAKKAADTKAAAPAPTVKKAEPAPAPAAKTTAPAAVKKATPPAAATK